jgi:hypothetical protein
MADKKKEKKAEEEERSQVRVAMNYVLVIGLIAAIGIVLIKAPSDGAPAMTGSVAVNTWCQTYQSAEDCKEKCYDPTFESYQECLDTCVTKLDECKNL